MYSLRSFRGGQKSLFVVFMKLVKSVCHGPADDGSAASGALCGLELSLRVGQLGAGPFPKLMNPYAFHMVFSVEFV